MRKILLLLLIVGLTVFAQDKEAQKASSKEPPKKPGGLLDALYPVAQDEAIAKGRILGGATLSLIQGTTDGDALNILIGDIAKLFFRSVATHGNCHNRISIVIGFHYSRSFNILRQLISYGIQCITNLIGCRIKINAVIKFKKNA